MKNISIGIPTYEMGNSLFHTMQSIYRQTWFDHIDKIYIAVDGKKINTQLLKKIRHKKLVILAYKNRLGQSTRINNLLSHASGDSMVLLNDDVVIAPDAIEKITKKLLSSNASLVAGHVQPLKSKSFFEDILYISYRINHSIATRWNKGDNYLSCNGRFIAVRKSFIPAIKLPTQLLNSDSYLYIYTKIQKKKFVYAEDAVCSYRDPSTLREYLNQSKKFQNSQIENMQFLGKNIVKYYGIPTFIQLQATFINLAKNPILATIYLVIYLYSRLAKYDKIYTIGYWNTDLSTKRLFIF